MSEFSFWEKSKKSAFGLFGLSRFCGNIRISEILNNSSFKNLKRSIEILIEEIKLVVSEKFEFQSRFISKLLAVFGNFGQSKVWLHGERLLANSFFIGVECSMYNLIDEIKPLLAENLEFDSEVTSVVVELLNFWDYCFHDARQYITLYSEEYSFKSEKFQIETWRKVFSVLSLEIMKTKYRENWRLIAFFCISSIWG